MVFLSLRNVHRELFAPPCRFRRPPSITAAEVTTAGMTWNALMP